MALRVAIRYVVRGDDLDTDEGAAGKLQYVAVDGTGGTAGLSGSFSNGVAFGYIGKGVTLCITGVSTGCADMRLVNSSRIVYFRTGCT